MSFINNFTLSSSQYVAVKFKRNNVRIGFCHEHIVILKQTQSMTTIDFRFELHKNLVLCNPGRGGGELGQFLLGMYRWPLRTPTPL